MVKFKGKLFIIALVFLGLVISSQAMAGVCTVPGTHASIQAAVSDLTCDPINVGAAMFTESGQILINRNLTISGAGAGNTVIKKAENTGDTGSGNNRGWFLVTAGNSFNLSGVTLDGDGKQICIAVLSFGTTTVEDCDIKNISWTSESYYGRGICLYGGSGNAVRRCTFSNIRRIGVFVFGSGISATIEGCTYVGKGVGDWLDYAFEVGGGGNFTINKCSVSNNLGVAVDLSTSAGILATTYFGAGTSATVTNSTITNCTEGIAVGYSSDDTTLLVANYNSISGNTDYGVNNVSAAVVVNAENNWWGDASGPGPVGLGTGDNVSLNVDYDPWLQIYWKDYNGENPGGYMPDIDQNQDFDKVIVRTEETGVGVSYTGTWINCPDPPCTTSGGTLKYSNDLVPPEASCSFTFNGTSISWIGFKQNNMGISEVWIDGQLDATVDLYNGVSLWKQVLYTNNNLSHGQHTITIKPTNLKNPLSTGLYTGVDAFDVDNKEQEYCAPVAEANSLWWLDKKYDLGLFDIDTHTEYVTDVNEDGSNDIIDLVQELALLMGTNVGQTGTTVEGEQHGIDLFLTNHNLTNKLYEHTVTDNTVPEPYPDLFHYIEAEVERSQDVKLDLGFWQILACDGGPGSGSILWQRVGGHAVTVAGVDSQNFLLAISDPDNDAAENGGLGVIRPVPGGHLLHPNDPSVHNNEANASHDIYTVVLSASPGGIWALKNYPGKVNFPTQEWGQPMPTPWPPYFYPCEESMIITEIEAAVIVSPIICGNGVIDPGETCDPPGLPGPNPLQPGICRAAPAPACTYCGDRIPNNGEQCDDGNGINNDGCRNNCMLPICGDGIISTGETCEPPGIPMPPNNNQCRQVTCTYCGDNIVNNGEQCDDGNANNNDACTNNCTSAVCGDGIVQPIANETCDPSGSKVCPSKNPGCLEAEKRTCRNNCTYCGDDAVPVGSPSVPKGLDLGEQCDDGNVINNNGCTNSCTTPNVTCSFTPAGSTQLRPGGLLKFWAKVTNSTGDPQTFQAATKVQLPGAPVPGPLPPYLIQPVTINLGAGNFINQYLTYQIPWNAQMGPGNYRGYVGVVGPPALLYNQCLLPFTVIP